MKRCPACDTVMIARYQNTGHTPPEGESYEEIESYHCPVCGCTDDEVKDDK